MISHIEPNENVVFPCAAEVEGETFRFTLMDGSEKDLLVRFGAGLEGGDRVFMRMDLTNAECIEDWAENIVGGRTRSVLVWNEAGDMVGFASLHHNRLLWTRHIGEMRIFLLGQYRMRGLGRLLAEMVLGLARSVGLQIVFVNIPRLQPDIQEVLRHMGFQAEALLADWLIDPEGNTHDMVVMAYRFKEVADA